MQENSSFSFLSSQEPGLFAQCILWDDLCRANSWVEEAEPE